MEPGSCGFFAYVNPPRSPVVLEDTPLLLLLWSLSGPGHGQLMHNSAEFWMIILYGTVYFFWPFISSCALSLPASPSLSLPFTISFSSSSFFCSFHYFYTVSSCLRSKWFRVDGDAKIIIKCSSRVQGPVEAAAAMCYCCHVRCLLNQKLRTFDQPHMTAPPPCKSPPSAPSSSQQIETNPHPFVESGNASFDFILCAQSGQQKTNKKRSK